MRTNMVTHGICVPECSFAGHPSLTEKTMQNVAAESTGRSAGNYGAGDSLHLLPISKLRGLTSPVRAVLKSRRVTTCQQLLRAAARVEDRLRLARETGLDLSALLTLVQRADMARVNGIGTVFGRMLEDLGITDVALLAAQRPAELHERLRRYNQEERIARRSPTPEEVTEWVDQARELAPLISY
jgi:predicted flap endonuclease-1-like 5' DNA nuclease